MFVLSPVGAVFNGFGRTFQVNLEAIPLADGINPAPRRTK
jgi:hypothetical protein